MGLSVLFHDIGGVSRPTGAFKQRSIFLTGAQLLLHAFLRRHACATPFHHPPRYALISCPCCAPPAPAGHPAVPGGGGAPAGPEVDVEHQGPIEKSVLRKRQKM